MATLSQTGQWPFLARVMQPQFSHNTASARGMESTGVQGRSGDEL